METGVTPMVQIGSTTADPLQKFPVSIAQDPTGYSIALLPRMMTTEMSSPKLEKQGLAHCA